jgi:DNA-binding CsgD family transcriptional regulator
MTDSIDNEEKLLQYFDNLKGLNVAHMGKNSFDIGEIKLLHNTFLYIHDFKKAVITEIRGMKDVLGWKHNEMSIRELFHIIHKDDRFLVYDITRYIIEKIMAEKLMPNALEDILCLTYRMATADGNHKMILRQSSIIEKTSDGIPTKALSICTDIDYFDAPSKVRFHSVGIYNNIVNFEDYISKNKPKKMHVFTRREVELLNLLSQGLTSRQISDILFISEHTVHKHISNMKVKASSRNTRLFKAIS